MADAITYEWTGAADASPSVKRVNGTVVATNIIPNPAFRKGLLAPGFSVEPAIDATQQEDGSVRVITRTGSSQSFIIGEVPHAEYTLVLVGRSFQGGSTAIYGGNPQGQSVPFTADYATHYIDITQTDTNGNLYLAVISPGDEPTNGFDLKSLMLVPGHGYRGGYFDGGTPRGTSYAWTGTPNASSSVKTVDGVVTATNHVRNPRGVGLAFWAVRQAVTLAETTSLVTGDHAVDVTLPPGADSGSALFEWGNSDNSQRVPVTAGTTYRLSAFIEHLAANPGGAVIGVYVDWYNAAGFVSSSDTGNNLYAQGFAGEVAGNVTAPAEATSAEAYVYFFVGAASSGTTIRVSHCYIGDPGPYFDGSSAWDIYATATQTNESAKASDGQPEFTSAGARTSTSTLNVNEDREFTNMVERIIESESAGWGSVPALLTVGYDSVGPFRVGDSPLTAWAIEVNSDTNFYGVFESGEVSILDPAGQVVAVRVTSLTDNDTLIFTIPVGTFTTAGIYRLVPRLIGRGSVTLESVPIVVQADDGWQTIESARAIWADAPTDDGYLFRLLDVARTQCETFAPDFVGRAPSNYAHAQLLQARALWASGNVSQGDQFGDNSGLSVTVFPMDWTVKNLLRPSRAVKAFF